MSTTGKLLYSDPLHSSWGQILAWDAEHFSRPWGREDWMKLDQNHHQVLVWEKNNVPVGFALFGTLAGDEAAHLYKIFVLPAERATGTASKFMSASSSLLREEGFKRIYLEVEAENKRAIGFYKKMGFVPLRVIKGFYSDGMDAVTMDLTL